MNEIGLGEGVISPSVSIRKRAESFPSPVWEHRPRPFLNQSETPMGPEFTTPLNGRTLVVGYNGTLTCAIRGRPRPRVQWFKNQQEITNDPKFKVSWGQGIVQLEICRATRNDAGIYTCLGQDKLNLINIFFI